MTGLSQPAPLAQGQLPFHAPTSDMISNNNNETNNTTTNTTNTTNSSTPRTMAGTGTGTGTVATRSFHHIQHTFCQISYFPSHHST